MENYTAFIEESITAGIMQITNCCNSMAEMLPGEALPFLPSFLIGLLISSIVLIWLVRKETKEPLYDVIKDFFQQLINAECSVIQQAEKAKLRELHGKVALRWDAKNNCKTTKRIELAVQNYIEQSEHEDASIEDEKQISSLFHVPEMSSIPWWNEHEIFSQEQKILKKKFPKIKEEFSKAFADFQKGICKQWLKIELENKGHSCIYPLITEGVINTLNCSSCPSTFQVLSDCRILGLTGCVFGNASFTLIYPDSKIVLPKHTSNITIRCQLVLQKTTPGYLEVSGTQHEWTAGEVMLFDPSYSHTIFLSDSKSMDVVATPLAILSLELWHPGLDLGEKKLISELFCQ